MSLISGYYVVKPWMLKSFSQLLKEELMRAEIQKQVYSKYPESKKEKECAQEKSKRDYLRAEYKKKLIKGIKEKKQYENL